MEIQDVRKEDQRTYTWAITTYEVPRSKFRRFYPSSGPNECMCIRYPELSAIEFARIHNLGKTYLEIALLRLLPDNSKFTLFNDDDITLVHPSVRTRMLKGNVLVRYASRRKPSILQSGIYGSQKAAARMLLLGNEKSIFTNTRAPECLPYERNSVETILVSAGLEPVATTIQHIERLRTLILQNGPAVVEVNWPNSLVQKHTVIVDEVSDTSISIRDPWHCWEVDIRSEAFYSKLSLPLRVVQVCSGPNEISALE